MLTTTLIASICHDANRALCIATGDLSQALWGDAPAWQRSSAIDGVEFLLERPESGDSALHENWWAGKLKDGWTYGPVKDPEAKTHPCLVRFVDLPLAQKAKDRLFVAIVRSMKFLIPAEERTRALMNRLNGAKEPA